MKRRIAERARRMRYRRASLRQIQFDIQRESAQFIKRQSQRLRMVQQRKRRRGTCRYELRNRKSWHAFDQEDDDEILAIKKETQMFVSEQKRKLENLVNEENRFKQRHELEHHRDLRFYAKQVMEEYEDWEEEYASSEYDTDCFPPDDYITETDEEEWDEENEDEDEDDEQNIVRQIRLDKYL
jgi:hypothetical protein